MLLLAAGVSYTAAFLLMVNPVLTEPGPDWVAWVLVAGLTMSTLSLARFVGLRTRQALELRKVTISTSIWISGGTWLSLGIIMVLFRCLDSTPATVVTSTVADAIPPYLVATLFLMLYVAGGPVAALQVFSFPIRVDRRANS